MKSTAVNQPTPKKEEASSPAVPGSARHDREDYEATAERIMVKYGLSKTKIVPGYEILVFRWAMFGGYGYVKYWHDAEPDDVRKVYCEMMRALEWAVPGEYKINVSPELPPRSLQRRRRCWRCGLSS